MPRTAVIALAAASLLALSGCALGPDPDDVQAEASQVFDGLVAELGAVDAAVLRTLEVVPVEAAPCAEDDYVQESFVARGTLSVQAQDDAAGSLLSDLAGSLEGEWEPAATDGEGRRAWSSEDGIVVTLANESPVIVVAVFPPCAPAG